MNLVKRITSIVLSFSLSLLLLPSVQSNAAEKKGYVYDSIFSEKSKDPASESEQPFNVFDIYNAYYGIVTTATTTSITMVTATETTAVSTTFPTTTLKKTTVSATSQTTTLKKTTVSATSPTTTLKKTTVSATSPTTTLKKTTVSATSPTTTLKKTTVSATSPTTTSKNTTVSATSPITTLKKTTVSATSSTTTSKLTTTTNPLTTASTQTSTSSSTQETVTSAPVTTSVSTVFYNGIDVSQWQSYIDWQTMKNSGTVDYAIIKAGYGRYSNQEDPLFRQNMANAQAVGMDVGLYWFSYALSVEEAKQEAYACLDVIKGYSFTYPIYYDFEYSKALSTLTPIVLSQMVDAFCTILQENGYYVGIYASGSVFEYQLYEHVYTKYDIWVAEHGVPEVRVYKGSYDMWQYTDKGRVAGISVNVDLNYCYKDYPSIIGVNPMNGSLPVTTSPPIVTTTTSQSPVTETAQTAASTSDQTSSQTTTASTTTEPTTTAPVVTENPSGYVIENTSDPYDWSEFDKNTYQYAMIVAQAEQDLDDVKANIDAAHNEGINCGIIYIAEDAGEDKVIENAEKLYEMLRAVKLEYPVYYRFDKSDLSDYSTEAAQLSANAEAFCSYFEDKHYFVGIAAYDNVLTYQLDNALFKKYSVWLLNEKDTQVTYKGKCGMISNWDDSIGGYVHYSIEPFPTYMVKFGLNGYTKTVS